jgi:hypothetical protein
MQSIAVLHREVLGRHVHASARWQVRRIVLVLALAGGTYAACDAHADSLVCDHAALARAEATVLDAQARYATATGWGAQNRAVALVAAAGEQLRTARQLCDVSVDGGADPFAVATLPTEPLELDPDTAVWLLVCGDSTAEECAGIAVADDERTERW